MGVGVLGMNFDVFSTSFWRKIFLCANFLYNFRSITNEMFSFYKNFANFERILRISNEFCESFEQILNEFREKVITKIFANKIERKFGNLGDVYSIFSK